MISFVRPSESVCPSQKDKQRRGQSRSWATVTSRPRTGSAGGKHTPLLETTTDLPIAIQSNRQGWLRRTRQIIEPVGGARFHCGPSHRRCAVDKLHKCEKKIYNTSRSRTSRTIQSLKLKSRNIAKGWRRTRMRRRRMKGWGLVGERGGHVTRLE